MLARMSKPFGAAAGQIAATVRASEVIARVVVHDRSSAVDGGDRSIAPEYVS
jgi:hypothetical protein